EQERYANRRAGGDVRYATYTRAYRASCCARRRKISEELAGLVARSDGLGSRRLLDMTAGKPSLLEARRTRSTLIQCATEIPKPKLSCKQLNVESARFNSAVPLGWRAWSNRFSGCSKPLAKIRSAKGWSERRAALRAHSNS